MDCIPSGSSVCEILWPGILQSLGSQRVGHDWATEQDAINFILQLKKKRVTKNKRISFCKDSEWKINFETDKRKIKILIIYDLLFSYCFGLVFGQSNIHSSP